MLCDASDLSGCYVTQLSIRIYGHNYGEVEAKPKEILWSGVKSERALSSS